jgi:hypothetical protein
MSSNPVGLGVGTTVQVEPFHSSVSVICLPQQPENPTAMQKVALVHETPSRELRMVSGLGLGMMDQLVPFHRSTRVWTEAPLVE